MTRIVCSDDLKADEIAGTLHVQSRGLARAEMRHLRDTHSCNPPLPVMTDTCIGSIILPEGNTIKGT